MSAGQSENGLKRVHRFFLPTAGEESGGRDISQHPLRVQDPQGSSGVRPEAGHTRHGSPPLAAASSRRPKFPAQSLAPLSIVWANHHTVGIAQRRLIRSPPTPRVPSVHPGAVSWPKIAYSGALVSWIRPRIYAQIFELVVSCMEMKPGGKI